MEALSTAGTRSAQDYAKARKIDAKFGFAYAGMAALRNLGQQQEAEKYASEAVGTSTG